MSARHKVRIPDHMADTSKEIDLEIREDITQAQFTQAYNTCTRLAEGAQVTWNERALMLSNLVAVNGKPVTPGEWNALFHGEWYMMEEFCRMAGNWICVMLETGRLPGKEPDGPDTAK